MQQNERVRQFIGGCIYTSWAVCPHLQVNTCISTYFTFYVADLEEFHMGSFFTHHFLSVMSEAELCVNMLSVFFILLYFYYFDVCFLRGTKIICHTVYLKSAL